MNERSSETRFDFYSVGMIVSLRQRASISDRLTNAVSDGVSGEFLIIHNYQTLVTGLGHLFCFTESLYNYKKEKPFINYFI